MQDTRFEIEDKLSFDQFRDWVKEGRFPKLSQTHQLRSIKTVWSLLSEAEKLLQTQSFDSLSIDELCSVSSATVGSFYARFESKQAFFETMQDLALLRSEKYLANLIDSINKKKYCDLNELCVEFAKATVKRFRQSRGVIRASVQKSDDGMWDRFKDIGDRFRSTMAIVLTPYLLHMSDEAREFRIKFAHQAMVGMLIHTILNSPRAVSLDDDAYCDELGNMMSAYLLG